MSHCIVCTSVLYKDGNEISLHYYLQDSASFAPDFSNGKSPYENRSSYTHKQSMTRRGCSLLWHPKLREAVRVRAMILYLLRLRGCARK
jgi:hypothetical protein